LWKLLVEYLWQSAYKLASFLHWMNVICSHFALNGGQHWHCISIMCFIFLSESTLWQIDCVHSSFFASTHSCYGVWRHCATFVLAIVIYLHLNCTNWSCIYYKLIFDRLCSFFLREFYQEQEWVVIYIMFILLMMLYLGSVLGLFLINTTFII